MDISTEITRDNDPRLYDAPLASGALLGLENRREEILRTEYEFVFTSPLYRGIETACQLYPKDVTV